MGGGPGPLFHQLGRQLGGQIVSPPGRTQVALINILAGGFLGSLLTGVFAAGTLSASAATPDGLQGVLEGNPGQFLIQVYAVVATLLFSGIGSFILLKIVDLIVGLRVSDEAERDGLDLSLHGESIQ